MWFSEGELTDEGYMVLITVPMKSLRFSESDEQLWRIQFNRQITRYGEQSFWPEYSIDVEGDESGRPHARNLKCLPAIIFSNTLLFCSS